MRARSAYASAAVAALAVLLAGAEGHAQHVLPDPHNHKVVDVHQRPWATDLAPDVRLVRVRGHARGADTTSSPNREWRAFVVFPKGEPGGRVRLESLRTAEAYEIRGVPLSYRPISDIVWIDHRYLAFDRWSQPHHGLHYLVDVVRHRVVLVAMFPG